MHGKRKSAAAPDAWAVERCRAAIESLRTRLAPLRDGRLGPEIVGLVRADGGALLREIATVERAGERVEVRPHDASPRSVQSACKSLIREGLMAHVVGPGLLAVSAAPGQEERISAIVGRAAEQARVSVRNQRQAARAQPGADDAAVQLAIDGAMREIDEILRVKLRCVGR